MPKQRKADAAERIAAKEYPFPYLIGRKQLAARIRRAIRAAVKAERKGMGKR